MSCALSNVRVRMTNAPEPAVEARGERPAEAVAPGAVDSRSVTQWIGPTAWSSEAPRTSDVSTRRWILVSSSRALTGFTR